MRITWKQRRIVILVSIFFLTLNVFFICFYIPMVYPNGYIHYLFGVPVAQPFCEQSSEKYYLTISVIVKDGADCIAEWIEFHLMVGVQHIYLYDNESTDNLKQVLSPYIKKNLVTVIPFSKQYVVLIDGSTEIITQKLFLRTSIETHACETRWMAMIDCDEFILPSGNASINNNGLINILKRFEGFTSVVIPWLYFTSNGWITKPNKLVVESYTRRWTRPIHTWKHILQPKRIRSVYSVHNFRSIQGYYSVNEKMEPFANWPGMLNGHITKRLYHSDSFYPFDVIKLHHYETKSAEDWESRLTTGEVSGTDTGLTGPKIKEHWETYFKLQSVDSVTDTTMMKYVEPLRKKLRERFTNELYQHEIE